jgi:hypothetical protein
MRGDQLAVGDVVLWRECPATVQSVSVGRQVEIIVNWSEWGSDYVCRITYPLLTAAEWNAEWTDEDFAARLESDLDAVQFDLITG